MIILIISIVILYLVYKIMRTVLYEPRGLSTTLAIFMCLIGSLLFSYLIAPKEKTTYKYGIQQLIKSTKIDDYKSNKDITDDLDNLIKSGKDTLCIKTIRYDTTKYMYLKHMYPKKVIQRLVNRNQTFLK